uniref:MH2 domain-containing protein n=1 Tax=Heterorhabditis bacteriophora TaxID=37862 RepID=A0A1I7XIY6_HETBA
MCLGDAVSTSANDGGVSSSNTDWMADAPLPPDPLPGDLLMSEPVSYPQHQYPAMMREASFNCRYGAVHRGGRPINYHQYAPQHVQRQYVQMQQHLPVGHVPLQQQRIQQFPQSSHNINHHIQERYRTLPTESRHTASSSFASTYTQLQPSTARPQTLHAHGQSQLHMNTPRQSQQKIGSSSITTPQGQQHYGQSMQQPTVPSQDRMSPGSNIRTVPQVTQVADESNTHRNTVHVIPSADTQARISNAEGADFIPNEWALILLYEFRDRISFENGRAHLTCLGESPVFVQSPLHAGRFGDDPATVYRLSGAQDANLECRTMEIFDETAFNLRIDQAKLQGYRHVYALQSLCIIRVSFVKGFGKLYRRMRILDTPCWIEVHFVNYLQKLDRVSISIHVLVLVTFSFLFVLNSYTIIIDRFFRRYNHHLTICPIIYSRYLWMGFLFEHQELYVMKQPVLTEQCLTAKEKTTIIIFHFPSFMPQPSYSHLHHIHIMHCNVHQLLNGNMPKMVEPYGDIEVVGLSQTSEEVSFHGIEKQAENEDRPLDLSIKRSHPNSPTSSRPSVIMESQSASSNSLSRISPSITSTQEPDVHEHFRRSLSGKWPRKTKTDDEKARASPITRRTSFSSHSNSVQPFNQIHFIVNSNGCDIEDHFRKALSERDFEDWQQKRQNTKSM